ncbi:MAG TPA: glycosyltransferase [Propionibacteriaceae bacterium]|nr:glycosyltransferase [Propionibacteriaceae bacterium]
MRILLWHVHGSWTTAFVQGPHDYVVPVLPDRDADGVGRARTWDWPASVRELSPDQLKNEPFDVVVLQRPHELELVPRWTGRRPGADLPAVYLEHNAPNASACGQRHPLADSRDIPIVHVTHFNRLYWDNGVAPNSVIEHGIVDPGDRYTGELARGAVVVNEPGRRGRTVGADLVPGFAGVGPVDVFGMQTKAFAATLDTDAVVAHENLFSQDDMHTELARRRVYVHPMRWTSLGLSLIEAMHLAMPVVGLAATEAVVAVPPAAGVLSTDPERLHQAFGTYLRDPDAARAAGVAARAAALERYGLARFLADWDEVLDRLGAGDRGLSG